MKRATPSTDDFPIIEEDNMNTDVTNDDLNSSKKILSEDKMVRSVLTESFDERDELIKKGELNPYDNQVESGDDFVLNEKESIDWMDDSILTNYYERLTNDAFDVPNGLIDSIEPKGEHKVLRSGCVVRKELFSHLYTHQRVGLNWMFELHKLKKGGIIGDEMGLGKTLMILSLIEALQSCEYYYAQHTEIPNEKKGGLKGTNGNVLIVAPLTLVSHWVKEAHRFVPSLRIIVLHKILSSNGSDNIELLSQTKRSVYITTYDFVRTHRDELNIIDFGYIILDEGHKIKNPSAEVTIAIKSLTTCYRLLLSGSPVQNNYKEFWTLFDFVYPGKLGTLAMFQQHFVDPIRFGSYTNSSYFQYATALKCTKALREIIDPFLLRRLKKDVLPSLPNKEENVLYCKLSDKQREKYVNYIQSSEVTKAINGELNLLKVIDHLRKICNHPHLLDKVNIINDANIIPESGKLMLLQKLLRKWNSEHKTLIFCQTKQMLSIVERMLCLEKIQFIRMDGTVQAQKRSKLIDSFNHDDSIKVFILTTRVGGLGINLTGADRVILFDPDWNPTVDSQAKERVLRIGQKKDVVIYRFVSLGTIEEKIYHRQVSKEIMSDKILSDKADNIKKRFRKQVVKELFTFNENQVESEEESSDNKEIENDSKTNMLKDVVDGNEDTINALLVKKSKGITYEEKLLTDEETEKIADYAIKQLKITTRKEISQRHSIDGHTDDLTQRNAIYEEKLAKRIVDFIEEKHRKVTTDEFLHKFNDVQGDNQTRVFRQLLRKLCKYDKKSHFWIPY
ncbi:DNA repair and recombination protein RAD26 [Entamoeba marina]